MGDLAALFRDFDAAMRAGNAAAAALMSPDGDTVLVRQTSSFRADPSLGGGEAVVVMATLVTVRDGQFAKIDMFEDEPAARAAMARSGSAFR